MPSPLPITVLSVQTYDKHATSNSCMISRKPETRALIQPEHNQHLLTGQLVLLGVWGARPQPGAPTGRDGQADQVSTAHLNPLLAVGHTGTGRQHHQQRQHTLVDHRHDRSSRAWTHRDHQRGGEGEDRGKSLGAGFIGRPAYLIVGLDFADSAWIKNFLKEFGLGLKSMS